MSEPDRPTPTSTGTQWPLADDPEATRVVPRGSQGPTAGDPSDAPPADRPEDGWHDDVSGDAADRTPGGDAGAGEPGGAQATPGASEASPGAARGDAPEASPGGPEASPGTAEASPGAASRWPGSDPAGAGSSSNDPDASSRPAPPSSAGSYAPGQPSGPQPSAPYPGSHPAAPAGAAADTSPPTSYIGAPTAAYPGPGGTTGYAASPAQTGYSYQRDADYPGQAASGPQFIPAPTTNVVLPPVRMPKAESRVAMNILGTVVGLLLVAGGLVLLLIFSPRMRSAPFSGTSVGQLGGSLDVLAVVLTAVGGILIAVAALLAAWASWAPIVPGVLLSAASVWAMVTTGAGSGGDRIARGTRWVFTDGQLAGLCMSGLGLAIGLVLFASGLAAVFLRAGVRRTIRQQLESIQV